MGAETALVTAVLGSARMKVSELGLLELPEPDGGWLWAFTCPSPACACRFALVLTTRGDREALLQRGRPVAETWLSYGDYARVAEGLAGVTTFAIDLDTCDVFPPVGDTPLELEARPEVRTVVDRLDDDVLDAIARLWHLGKGQQPPPEPGAGGANIEIEGFRPGNFVVWDDARQSLRGDTYVFGDHIFEAVELYCVQPDCRCGVAIVNFGVVAPRGAPHPGHIKIDGGQATLLPDRERHRTRLTDLWAAYCKRHPNHRERFTRRGAIMHGLAGRIVAAPPRPKVGRNEPCPCGSGKKLKKCCGVA